MGLAASHFAQEPAEGSAGSLSSQKPSERVVLRGGGSCDASVCKRFGGAELCTGGTSAAQVALNHLIVDIIDQGASKRTGRHTGPAVDATLFIEFDRSGGRVAL